MGIAAKKFAHFNNVDERVAASLKQFREDLECLGKIIWLDGGRYGRNQGFLDKRPWDIFQYIFLDLDWEMGPKHFPRPICRDVTWTIS